MVILIPMTMYVFTSVSVKALTFEVQDLKSKVAENTHTSNFDDSANVVVEDVPIGDQEYDDDNDTIEEEPGFSSGGDDLLSESNEETETEDELIETNGKRKSSICC